MEHRFPVGTEARISRRDLLRRGGMGFGLVGLAGVMAAEGVFSSTARADVDMHPLAPKEPPFSAKAQRVVPLFMNGGPSQVDTFDPKPPLDTYHGKPLPNPN